MDVGMIETTIEIKKLTATDGHVLTNGEAYGKEIYLGKFDSPENWSEITEEEYEAVLAEQERQEEEEM